MIEALHRGFASDDESVVVAERSKDQDYLHLSTTPPLASFDPREQALTRNLIIGAEAFG